MPENIHAYEDRETESFETRCWVCGGRVNVHYRHARAHALPNSLFCCFCDHTVSYVIQIDCRIPWSSNYELPENNELSMSETSKFDAYSDVTSEIKWRHQEKTIGINHCQMTKNLNWPLDIVLRSGPTVWSRSNFFRFANFVFFLHCQDWRPNITFGLSTKILHIHRNMAPGPEFFCRVEFHQYSVF